MLIWQLVFSQGYTSSLLINISDSSPLLQWNLGVLYIGDVALMELSNVLVPKNVQTILISLSTDHFS